MKIGTMEDAKMCLHFPWKQNVDLKSSIFRTSLQMHIEIHTLIAIKCLSKIFALAIYSTICIEFPFCVNYYLQVYQIFVLTYKFISAPSVNLCRLSIYKNVSLHPPFIFKVFLVASMKITILTYLVLKISYRTF